MNKGALDVQLAILVPEFPLATYAAESLGWYNEAQKEIGDKKLITGKSSGTSTAAWRVAAATRTWTVCVEPSDALITPM